LDLQHWLVIAILCVPLIFVVINRLRMDMAAMLMAAALGLLQLGGIPVLGASGSPQDAIKAISGFSQPVVITLISLFILTQGLNKSGVTSWFARVSVRLAGEKQNNLIALLAASTAFLSLFMNNLAAGAMMLPSALEVSRRTKIKPSKLLIPVAYGSLLGGSATYFTTANIIMSDLLQIAHPPQTALRILDFSPTGGLIAIAGIFFLWLFGNQLLPEHEPASGMAINRLTGGELQNYYLLDERMWQGIVRPSSPLVGKTLEENRLGEQYGVNVIGLQRDFEELTLPSGKQILQAQDRLLLVGHPEKVNLVSGMGLEIKPSIFSRRLRHKPIHFAEVILRPHSKAEGKTLKELRFRNRFGVSVVALKRLERSFRSDIGNRPLQFGDSCLVIGDEASIHRLGQHADFMVVEADTSDQPVRLRQAVPSMLIILAAIVASILGAPIYLCLLMGALLSILLRIQTMEEAYASIEWQAIFLVAGMYAVSQALIETGLAEMMGQALIALASQTGPLGVAAGSYILTGLLSQVVGGQVAALVTGPITISAAITMGINPQAVAVATAIGCSASFLTPMAHPVNILMIAPANYTFRDFFRVGWILTILCFIMLLVGLRFFWQL